MSVPSVVLRLKSDTLLAGFDEKDFAIAPRSAGVLLVTGDSIAANLMPSELLAPTTWLLSPVFGSWVVKSLNGIGILIAKDPFVDAARCHPEPSSALTPTRCISSLVC